MPPLRGVSGRIPVNEGIVVAVGVEVETERIRLAAEIAVLLHEAGQLGVVGVS